MAPTPFAEVDVAGRTVRITNPDKVYFPARGETKLDLANYYVAVGEGALRGVRERPTVLKRYPGGATEEPFFQKRVPPKRPEWIETVRVTFPSGRHPDELRVDLDPQPGVPYEAVKQVAEVVHDVLEEYGYVGYPKTSGSRGIHVNVRIEPGFGFTECRRAALALAREVERRVPSLATSKWWKEERGERVFVDYNQNARDRTVASAYSVRANPEGRVSCPVTWEELAATDPADLTIATVPARYAERGDPSATIDDVPYSLQPLLELAARDEAEGLGDEAWPPHFPKAEGEPARVAPSRAKKARKKR